MKAILLLVIVYASNIVPQINLRGVYFITIENNFSYNKRTSPISYRHICYFIFVLLIHLLLLLTVCLCV